MVPWCTTFTDGTAISEVRACLYVVRAKPRARDVKGGVFAAAWLMRLLCWGWWEGMGRRE